MSSKNKCVKEGKLFLLKYEFIPVLDSIILLSFLQNRNRGQKRARHSREKSCFVKHVSFSMSNFHISTPSPLCNVITT